MIFLCFTLLLDFYEQTFPLIGGLTNQGISPQMWQFLQVLEGCLNDDAVDYFTGLCLHFSMWLFVILHNCLFI